MIARILVIVIIVISAIGCSAGGGQVDTGAVQKQFDKEKSLQKEANKKLPPGEGASN